MAERPGIMLYFDMVEPLKALGYEEKGMLFEAMLEYGQHGVIPNFDGTLTIAWGFIRPKLDTDAKSYRKKVAQSTHASYCRKEKAAERTPLSFDDWAEKMGYDSEWNRAEPSDSTRYPTTNRNSITIITPTPNSESFIARDGDGKGYKGKEEEENITDETILSRKNRYITELDQIIMTQEAQNGKQNYPR